MYFRPTAPQKIPTAIRKSDFKKFDAPIAGWISNRSLSNPAGNGEAQGAARLDNFFPTATTAYLRRGKDLYAQLGDGTKDVTSIFSYVNGLNRHLFASTEDTIYDITTMITPFNYRLVTDLGDALVTDAGDHFGESSTEGMNVFNNTLGGNWIVVQFATTGGIYLIGVNGESVGFIFDGTSFYPYVAGGVHSLPYDTGTLAFTPGAVVTGGTSGATGTIYAVNGTVAAGNLILTGVTGTFQNNEALTGGGGSALANGTTSIVAPGITIPGGLTTADMSFVWVYKSRLWFIQKDSLNSWYMDNADSIGGTLVKYPLAGIMGRGGHLVWGQAWSLDTGAQGGLSDQIAICSSEGEVAIFQGTFPTSSPLDWQQVGVYRVGKPMGNRSFFRGGGDIAVATSIGLQPLSKAITLDITALSQASISYNIQDAWQVAVDSRGTAGWQCELWPERKMAIISPPSPVGVTDPVLFVSNTETGAWCRFTNWDARAMEVYQGELYFGGPNGEVYKANVTGSDYGAVYTGIYMPLFDDLATPANKKVPKVGRGVARAATTLDYSLRFRSDFDLDAGSAPSASVSSGANTWGTAVWGTAVWGAETPSVITDQWKSLGGKGYACSMVYQVTSGSLIPLDVEIIRLEMTFTTAEQVT